MRKIRLSCTLYRRLVIFTIYLMVILVQLYLWPACEDDSSYSLMDDMEWEEFGGMPSNPSNLLNPPMWSTHAATINGHCGNWQKQYTKMHRAMMSGEIPPAYLVYTTGNGFPPNIQGIPQAMKGLATMFMLALLTERALIIDWKSPSGFDRIFTPRYADWTSNKILEEYPKSFKHIHVLGSPPWVHSKGSAASAEFFETTNFNQYFTNQVEVVQSTSFDFTYALLRNSHHQHRIRNLGLHTAKCRLCCFWHYLFKFTSLYSHNLQIVTRRKLKMSPSQDIVFIDLSLQRENLPKRTMMDYASNVMKCAEQMSRSLRNPVLIVASNCYSILDEVPKMYPQVVADHGVFFSRERYTVELNRELNSTTKHNVMIPKYEHNALMYFFVGYYLQLNSTILFTSHHSPYSETMAGFRHFYYSSGKYVVYPEKKCHLERYSYHNDYT